MNLFQIKYEESDSNGSATKVTVHFHLDSATWLSDQVKQILKVKLEPELTKDGFLVAKSGKGTCIKYVIEIFFFSDP